MTAFRDGQVTLRSNRRQDGFTNAVEEIGYQGVRSGDLVIHSMDGFAGAIGVSESDGKASPVVHCYRPSASVDVRYYAYLLRDLAICGFVTSLAKGIRERSTAFDVETFRSLVLPVPPLATQRAIADYLDTETARIDALIAKKQRMIELFKERRQALISSAIAGETTTRGGGVKLPVVPLKHLAALPITNGVGEAAEFEDPSWPRYIRTTDIAGPRDLRQDTFKSLPPDVARRAPLRQGDIVMTAAGATIGKSLLYGATGEACYAGYLVRFRPRKDVDGRFVAYWMESMHYWDQIATGKVVSTIENFSAGKYQNLSCPNHSPGEQRAIADYLDTETTRIDAIAVTLEQQIVLLRERRQALITAAVIGELEVSGVAA